MLAQFPNPRSSVDPQEPGLRTYDSHTGDSQPLSVDAEGQYVYAPTIYMIFAAVIISAVVLWLFLRKAKVPA